MSIDLSSLVPYPSTEQLKTAFVGQSLQDVPVPSAILDVSKVKQNCRSMLEAVEELQVSFRAHIKTHKTAEVTRLQVGADCKDVRLIVSTVTEAEQIVPLLLEYQEKGAKVNVLYGVPLAASSIPRLSRVAQTLGRGSLSVMVDNPAQLAPAQRLSSTVGFPVSVFIKTDAGYHRAGLPPLSDRMAALVREISTLESRGRLCLLGFYAHNSLSYGGSSPDDAMDMLRDEIEACRQASRHVPRTGADTNRPLVISVGASPTALCIQNIQPSNNHTPSSSSSSSSSSATRLRQTLHLDRPPSSSDPAIDLEIHAGVYAIFDLQQVASHARPARLFPSSDPHGAIALSILAETVSTYPDRTAEPEALVNAGTLALGREPCKAYDGWGVVGPWNMGDAFDREKRVVVARISQEHGVLGWEDRENKEVLPLVYGQRVRVWPNHACITGAGFGWYLVVDGEGADADKVVDVWVRWRGW